jgi:malate/lactate dehydrogenase
MSSVAIVGAGEIGGAAARALAVAGRVRSIHLIDQAPGVAAGKALDLRQAGPITGSDVAIVGSTELADAAGAHVIVLADASSDEDWSGEPGLGVLRRLLQLGALGQSILITAGGASAALLQRSFDELKLSRRTTVGSAPEALAATARALVAIEARVSSSQVSLTLLGNPPGKFVVPWGDASIGGHAIEAMLAAPQLNRIEKRLKGLWPPGPGALGAAAAVFCEAVALGSSRLLNAFVSLDRDNGTPAPVCAWPVTIGTSGLERVGSPVIGARERVVVDEVIGHEVS